MAALADLWARRELIVRLARRQVRRRYRGHILGPLWPFLNPLAMLAVYTLIFSVFLRADFGAVNADWATEEGPRGHLQFALIVFTGMVAYTFFAEAAGQASGMVRAEQAYVKRTVFPLEILAPVQLGALAAETLVGFALILVAQPFLGYPWTWNILLLPMALLPLVLFALAAGWLLGAVGAYIPDISELVSIALRILFFLTPVLFPLEVVPEGWIGVLKLNPLASILHGIRNVTLFGRPLVWASWLLGTAVTALLAWASHRVFLRLRPGLADVV